MGQVSSPFFTEHASICLFDDSRFARFARAQSCAECQKGAKGLGVAIRKKVPCMRSSASKLRITSNNVDVVHPIERLRHVARSGWAGSSILASEAAWALADLAETEAPALVPACRRLLDRQPGCGPLWWMAARVLCAGDPVAEALWCAEALEEDPTEYVARQVVPRQSRTVSRGGIGEVASADLVLVEVDALGRGGMVIDPARRGLLESARAAEVPVWVQSGVGRVLPGRLFAVMASRMRSDDAHRVLVDHRNVEKVVGPSGARALAVALTDFDCPEPPELLEDR